MRSWEHEPECGSRITNTVGGILSAGCGDDEAYLLVEIREGHSHHESSSELLY
jgi:hypothetical protein